jgi:hypothetical protein
MCSGNVIGAQRKSARNAIYECTLDKMIRKFISASGCANFSDSNRPKSASHHSQTLSISVMSRYPKSKMVGWSRNPPQLLTFFTRNVYHPFSNIISMSGWQKHFSANLVSRNYSFDHIGSISSMILLGEIAIKSYRLVNSQRHSGII